MNAESLETWTSPSDYFGFDPIGDYPICGQSRDSDVLERSNYECIFQALTDKAIELECQDNGINGEGDDSDMVYDYRASHWAVGWVETVLICQNAPQALLDYAIEIRNALSDYPVFDESHYCELEYQESQDYWESMAVSERVEIIQQYGSDASVFAARRDYVPNDCGVEDYLRTP